MKVCLRIGEKSRGISFAHKRRTKHTKMAYVNEGGKKLRERMAGKLNETVSSTIVAAS
jgi:hypothetical protein